jgi:small subunit ribosomal protein S2
MPKDETKVMFDNAVHIGHRTQKWNPLMKKFIHGEKDGLHIINLELTTECLDRALKFLGQSFSEGKVVLFVSTKPQSVLLIEETAGKCNMPYVSSKWIPGLLTNFPTIKTRIKYLKDLKSQEAQGELEKYTKKEAAKLKKEIIKLQTALGGVENMKKTPDVVFVLDTVRDNIAVLEAKKIGVPIVALVDTNANPSDIDYPIPANDDASKSLVYLLGRIAEVANKAPKPKDNAGE